MVNKIFIIIYSRRCRNSYCEKCVVTVSSIYLYNIHEASTVCNRCYYELQAENTYLAIHLPLLLNGAIFNPISNRFMSICSSSAKSATTVRIYLHRMKQTLCIATNIDKMVTTTSNSNSNSSINSNDSTNTTVVEIHIKDIQHVQCIDTQRLEIVLLSQEHMIGLSMSRKSNRKLFIYEAESIEQCHSWVNALQSLLRDSKLPSLKERIHRERGEKLIKIYNELSEMNIEELKESKRIQRRNTIDSVALKYNLNSNTV